MDGLLSRFDKLIREKFGEEKYDKVWDRVWDEIARFLYQNLDEMEVKRLEKRPEELGQALDRIEFGRVRLTEKINYLLDGMGK